MAPSPRAPALGAGNHTGPAAMNESKEEGCTGIAVGLLQVSCFDHRRCLRSIYGLHFTRLRRQAGLSLTTIIVERACSLSARDSSSTGEIRVKTIRLDQSRDRTPRVVGGCVESTHTPSGNGLGEAAT